MTLTDRTSKSKGPPQWLESDQVFTVQGRKGEDIVAEPKLRWSDVFDELRFELFHRTIARKVADVEVENGARTTWRCHLAISLPRERRDDRRAAKRQLGPLPSSTIKYSRVVFIRTERSERSEAANEPR